MAAYSAHIWVADITYLRYGRQVMYLAVVLDAYTRTVPSERSADL